MAYFKYTKNQYIQHCILNGVYGSKLKEVNDPFEWEGIVHPDNYRICCLTTSPKQMLMWAYYTNHRGCCVEYEFSDEIENGILKRVQYREDYLNHRFMNEDEIEKSLFYKGKEWERENEIRAVWHGSKNDQIWNNINGDIYLKGEVVSVTFGLLAEKDTDYLDALKTIRIHNKASEKPITVNKMIISDKMYGLIHDPQFNYEIAIQELENGR